MAPGTKTIGFEILKNETHLFSFHISGISMLCTHIVFSLDDRKMMERTYAAQKCEFYKLKLFVQWC